jgi:hypothetical protein
MERGIRSPQVEAGRAVPWIDPSPEGGLPSAALAPLLRVDIQRALRANGGDGALRSRLSESIASRPQMPAR